MAVVVGEEEEWRQWQRATMGVVVLDDIDDDNCDGAMDGNNEDNNGDGAMDNYDDDDDDVDGDGVIDDNDSDDNVVAQTPAHRRRRQHWQRILSRGRGQGKKIIPSLFVVNKISSYDPWLAIFWNERK
jgi:hypothetical protein